MTPPRVYTAAQVRAALHMNERTFRRLRASGGMPFLDEVKPRVGGVARFKAEPVDRYLAGQWGRPSLVFGRRAAR